MPLRSRTYFTSFLIVYVTTIVFGTSLTSQGNKPINHLDELCVIIDQNATISKEICINIGKELIYSTTSDQIKYKAYGYYGIGQGEFMAQNFTKSLHHLDSALILFQQLDDSVKIQQVLNRLGNINHLLGNDKLAFTNYQKSFKIALQLGLEGRIADLHNNLGLVCYRQKDYQQAEEYYSKALESYRHLNDEQSIGDVYYNLGMVYQKSGKYDKSRDLLEKSITIYNKFNDINSKASSLFILGEIAENKNDISNSDEYYMLSYNLFKATNDSMNMLPCILKLSYRAIRLEEFELAKSLIEQFKTINTKIKDIDGDVEVLKLQYILYKACREFEKSLFYLEELSRVKETMLQIEDKARLTQVREEFQSELQQQELIKTKENDRLKSLILVALIILILALISILLFYFRHIKAKQKQRLLLLEQKVLRTQMDPHFLFNSISAIQFYIMDDKPQEAIRFLGDFSALLRMVLQFSKDEFITIEKESKITEYYIELQTRRFENRVKLNLLVDSAIDKYTVMIPPMLAQPIIESFLEQNKVNSEETHLINIHYQTSHNAIILIIEDNFLSEKEELRPVLLHKAAIKITNERLELIKSIKHMDIKFSVNANILNNKIGTKATFIIPLREN